LKRSEPPDGATVSGPPAVIRIWFDGPIEPLYVSVRVEDRDKQRRNQSDGRVDRTDPSLLEIPVSPLPPGRYRVLWSVVARDGHRKEGHLAFWVK
jgi:methionine-rich copper-binding protein CopC